MVNDKTGFPPFSEVPKVDKFNQEVEGNLQNKSLLFVASVIPRESDGSIDWKGLDFLTYLTTVLQPQMEQIKFKPSFATQANYQELARRLTQEINTSLSSTCSNFTSLTNVSELNQLTNEYLSKIFQGYIYAENIHDELGKQLNIANHQKFKLDKTGNHSLNNGWNIALNEFCFKSGGSPNPQEEDLTNSTYQDLLDDLKTIQDELNRLIPITESNQPGSPYYDKWQAELFSYKNGLKEIQDFQKWLLSQSLDKQGVIEHRTYFRKKWNWFFRND